MMDLSKTECRNVGEGIKKGAGRLRYDGNTSRVKIKRRGHDGGEG